jgi:hypothetical protein
MRATALAAGIGIIGLAGAGVVWHFRTPAPAPGAPAPAAAAPPIPAPMASATRAEALALAERFLTHEWTATEANVFHGTDPDGIRVDTPDAGFDGDGWWVTTGPNIGIPYKWGGFDLPDAFDQGLRAGRYAGDAYSAEKRRLLDDAVSRHSVGIDCSGFVSRCWKLPRSYSTRELPDLCDPVTDLSQLRPADILNRHNAHVRLFAGWADDAQRRVRVYEAASKVRREEYDLESMIAQGYSAWRLRGIRD